MNYKTLCLLTILLVLNQMVVGQQPEKLPLKNIKWFSLGARNTLSTFDEDGTGLGSGGQFRIQISEKVNTDWFADYISIEVRNKVRSEYFHIGWSVLYYPFDQLKFPRLLQPYVLAGHCFDYNKKTDINDISNYKERWGSAVQAGLGTHFNLTDKADISFTCQYMIHLTRELEAETDGDKIEIVSKRPSTLEGHLLTTISLNYKIFKFCKK